ncbi:MULTISPECIES: DUF4126 domain-containing protein [Streptomyces]|uniref:DUF4126 domain-containing protein n=1 Tax=Streptomyces TaxID=1883 RepID=UPI00163D3008|nr:MULTISPECIES: DUF4126 domain-containing protein [Streptomyces]MBC2878754.1 DUF4126 domain-containing protein [Streptomyces sp. TYQ1024]UBI39325.1 DUF4126 domain-containing protein [Streptomyces mobaraensis]UKW31905.1 DUF4126 domain-containing protein [Streptomyces sp. TYQ1024]
MSVLPMVFTSGWASGINAYAVVLLLGLFGRGGIGGDVPEALQRPEVLIVAGVLFLCEAVADKVPYVDTVWDAVHTLVRPACGAMVGALLAGQSGGSLSEVAYGAVGGTTALVMHLVKMSTRMAVNTSPEPLSNILLSAAEDLGVAALVVFALFHPAVAAGIAGTLLVLGIGTVVILWRRVRAFRQRRRERKAARREGRTAEASA